MFRRKTLFIVGAGASSEFGLPVGRGLADEIGKKMDIRFDFGNKPVGSGDLSIYFQLTNQMQRNVREFQQAAWLIRDGILLARSIDDFVDLHRNDPHATTYGKAAIVKAVLEAERQSSLYFGGRDTPEEFSPGRFPDTWLVKLLQMLGPGIPRENVREIFDQVSFVVFNYDRCIEYFFLHALQNLYGIDRDTASSILDDLDIVHPYGVIDPKVSFGAERADYLGLTAGIKTYTEQIADANITGSLAEKVHQADTLVFLGFAYHEQNMLLLQPPKRLPASKRIFGTAYGMSGADVDVTSLQIDGWFEGGHAQHVRSMVKLENHLKCATLFDNYTKSLTAAR